MQTHWFADGLALYNYDCREVLPVLGDASVDSVVTDPPYGLEFMGKDWDSFKPAKGKWGDREHSPTLIDADDTPHHRSAVHQPAVLSRCQRCGGNSSGQWNRCACASPDFRKPVWPMQAYQAWCTEWAAECFRVLKPGGYLVAFGGTRTYHRLASAIEDAGFEIRDSLHWLYGSGFPKSLDVSKAIDKVNGRVPWADFAPMFAAAVKARGMTYTDVDRHLGVQAPGASSCYWARTDHRGGLPARHHWEHLRELLDLPAECVHLYDEAERAVIGRSDELLGRKSGIGNATSGHYTVGGTRAEAYDITAPATPDAARWEGWGTALKPAHEPIVLARKPLAGTVAQNVLAHGTGALNVDGCRVETDGRPARDARVVANPSAAGIYGDGYNGSRAIGTTSAGRWPPNVLLTHAADCDGQCAPGCPVDGLDGQSGTLHSQDPQTRVHSQDRKTRAAARTDVGATGFTASHDTAYGDSGGASRFFPQLNWSPEYDLPFLYQAKASAKERPRHADGSAHPTVKPLALMRWLARLVTPPGGTILDPFCGTGTTLQAARLEGFRSIGCDSWDQAAEMACQRLGLVVEADAG